MKTTNAIDIPTRERLTLGDVVTMDASGIEVTVIVPDQVAAVEMAAAAELRVKYDKLRTRVECLVRRVNELAAEPGSGGPGAL